MVGDERAMVEEAMGYLAADDRDALDAMLAGMSDGDERFLMGYVAGYVDAVGHVGAAEGGRDWPGLQVGVPSDTIAE